ncbi:hypothetical protein ABIA41_004493 [Bradyrhizobium sp. USDA 313]
MDLQLGVLLDVGFGDVCGAWGLPRDRLTNGKELAEKRGDRRFGQALSRHDQMADAESFNLVTRPSRIRIEDAGRNLLRFVPGMPDGDRFRCLDGEKLRLAARPRRRGNGVGGDFAVEGPDRHERIEGEIAREFIDLVGAELRHGDLAGLHSGGVQNDAQQRRIHRRPPDHADTAPREIGDLLDLRGRLSFRTLARKPGWCPEHDEILADDGDGLRLGRHVQVAAADGKIGLARPKQSQRFHRSVGLDRVQPDSSAFAGERIGHRLNDLVIIAASRSNGDPENLRPQRVIKCTRCDAEDEKANGENQQQEIAPSPLSAGRVTGRLTCTLGRGHCRCHRMSWRFLVSRIPRFPGITSWRPLWFTCGTWISVPSEWSRPPAGTRQRHAACRPPPQSCNPTRNLLGTKRS